MAKNKNKQETTGRKLSRVVTLVLGLGFAASTLVIALSSVFSQSESSKVATADPDTPSAEEQVKLQVTGYEKVLEREPKNATALEGLALIHLKTNPKEAIPTLEKLVKYYPERQEYAVVLEQVKKQAVKPTTAPKATPEAPASSK
ncbi:MAG: tetratricopeptide repeat protein [Hydrococcus sp. SU_1_0]|nr:tetratricopeptide repeat protein [Hydrococcus sp. SU_1_0]